MDYGMYRKADECVRRDFEGTRSYEPTTVIDLRTPFHYMQHNSPEQNK